MTTFWCNFFDPEAPRQGQFLGVVIVEVDETHGEVPTEDIILECWRRGCNPGGSVRVQEVSDEDAKAIPSEHRNKLITDDALLISLGSSGRHKTNVN